MPDTIAPLCPTCTFPTIMSHQGQGYVYQHLFQIWKCFTCGTVVEAQIPCIIRAPDYQSSTQTDQGGDVK